MWGQRTLFVCECEKCDRIHSIESQGSSDTLNSLSPAKYVELAPGVFAMRPVDGLVNLGIPLGTEAYVQRKVCESIRSHDERLRCLVALAQHTGSATRAGGRNIGRMCARIGLQYSALARNVHFLRSRVRRGSRRGAGSAGYCAG